MAEVWGGEGLSARMARRAVDLRRPFRPRRRGSTRCPSSACSGRARVAGGAWSSVVRAKGERAAGSVGGNVRRRGGPSWRRATPGSGGRPSKGMTDRLERLLADRALDRLGRLVGLKGWEKRERAKVVSPASRMGGGKRRASASRSSRAKRDARPSRSPSASQPSWPPYRGPSQTSCPVGGGRHASGRGKVGRRRRSGRSKGAERAARRGQPPVSSQRPADKDVRCRHPLC